MYCLRPGVKMADRMTSSGMAEQRERMENGQQPQISESTGQQESIMYMHMRRCQMEA